VGVPEDDNRRKKDPHWAVEPRRRRRRRKGMMTVRFISFVLTSMTCEARPY
jgi:hypothetical protein